MEAKCQTNNDIHQVSDVARKWVTEAEHGTIENQNNILIQ